jgi:hypothetical protein
MSITSSNKQRWPENACGVGLGEGILTETVEILQIFQIYQIILS